MADLEVFEKLLRENMAIAKDTNRLVHKMRRDAMWGRFFRIVLWVVVLGAPFLVYKYYLQEYLAKTLLPLQGLVPMNFDIEKLREAIPPNAQQPGAIE